MTKRRATPVVMVRADERSSGYFCPTVLVYYDVWETFEAVPFADDRMPFCGCAARFEVAGQRDTSGTADGAVYGYEDVRLEGRLRKIEEALPFARRFRKRWDEVRREYGEPRTAADMVRQVLSVLKPRAVYIPADGYNERRCRTHGEAIGYVEQAEAAWEKRWNVSPAAAS